MRIGLRAAVFGFPAAVLTVGAAHA